MRSMFRSVLVALVAALALSAVAAGSAAASEPEWYLNNKLVTESKATSLSSAAEAIRLEDIGVGDEIKCSLSGTGEVTEKGKGAISTVKFTKCHLVKVAALTCKKGVQSEEESHEWVKALGFPLQSQLKKVGLTGNLEDQLPSASGKLGFSYECTNVLGGKTTDVCTYWAGEGSWYEVPSQNEATGVRLEFGWINSRNVRFKCSIGGDARGLFEGFALLKGPTGETLSVK
jgi:hypothetical protein